MYPCERLTIPDTSSVPIPVVVIIQAMIPATEHAIPTATTLLAPAASDSIISVGVVLVMISNLCFFLSSMICSPS